MQRAHFAFRVEGSAHAGHHGSYTIKAENGRVTISTPRGARPHARAHRDDATLVLETRSIRTGDRVYPGGLPAQSVGPRGELEIHRGGVLETWTNTDAGSEQALRFDTRPSGGDLFVEIAASGLDFKATTPTGLHFAGADGLGFRYPHATWVDADGARTQILASFERGAIVLRVPEEVLAASRFPALLDPLVGPEHGIDEPVFVGAFAAQSRPNAAFGAGRFFVVWQDERTLDAEIWGTRVDANGTVLDPFGIKIGGEFGRDPAVAFDGENFVVVWSGQLSRRIWAARVSVNGELLDTAGINVSSEMASGHRPAIASNGNGVAIVWIDDRTGIATLRGGRVRRDGVVVEPHDILIGSNADGYDLPQLESDGTGYLVVWTGRTETFAAAFFGARLTADLALVDSPPFTFDATGVRSGTQLAFDGTEYVGVWGALESQFRIVGYRVSPASGLRPDSRFVVIESPTSTWDVSMAFDESNLVLAWREGTGVRMTRVGEDGVMLDPQGIRFDRWGADDIDEMPMLAAGGGRSLYVWSQLTFTAGHPSDVLGALLDASGNIVEERALLSTEPQPQYEPDVASDGEGFAVVWSDSAAGDRSRIFAARLAPSGEPLDDLGILVASVETEDGWLTGPSTAFAGTSYLVTWSESSFSSEQSSLRARQLLTDGSMVQAAPFAITQPGHSYAASATASASGYLVVYCEGDAWSVQDCDVRAVRVGLDGELLDADPIVIADSPKHEKDASAEFGGSAYMVTWWDANDGGSIRAARVGADGLLAGPSVRLDSGNASASIPHIAFDGARFFVAWAGTTAAGSPDSTLFGVRVATDGTVLDTPTGPLLVAGGNIIAMALGYDGSRFLVTYSRSPDWWPNTLLGANVTPPGAVAEADQFTLVASNITYDLDLATNGRGGALLAYASSQALTRQAGRLFVRKLCADDATDPSCVSMPQCNGADDDCDGVDDDCDGSTDEGFAPRWSTCGAGPCMRSGRVSCRAGVEQDSCVSGPAAALDTTCDLIDEDCDGDVDEDYVPAVLGCGVGACANTGATLCSFGSELGSCNPGVGAPDDVTCDHIDDDCDGTSDEDGMCSLADAGADDGGEDAGVADGGEDATLDGGMDAATNDASDVDAGAAVDASTQDAAPDAAPEDARVLDAAAPDAADASTPGDEDGSGGCGCRAGPPPSAHGSEALGLCFVVFAVFARRRRR